MRTISEILIDADATDEIDVLSNCWKEIRSNLKKYPLSQIHFALEHLENLAKELGRKHAKELKPIADLLFKDNYNTDTMN